MPSNIICELGGKNILTFEGRTYIGFAVTLSGLTPDQSQKLQREGLGKFKKYGCGMFGQARSNFT
jgi:hypothetical protein